jgi:hypothetical protein
LSFVRNATSVKTKPLRPLELPWRPSCDYCFWGLRARAAPRGTPKVAQGRGCVLTGRGDGGVFTRRKGWMQGGPRGENNSKCVTSPQKIRTEFPTHAGVQGPACRSRRRAQLASNHWEGEDKEREREREEEEAQRLIIRIIIIRLGTRSASNTSSTGNACNTMDSTRLMPRLATANDKR